MSLGIYCLLKCSFFFFFGPFAISRAAPKAGSQAMGPIRAVAAGLCQSHGNARSEPRLQPTPQLTAMPILNPLREARDRACVLMDASWVC